MSPSPALKAQQLRKVLKGPKLMRRRYPRPFELREINLEAGPGETVALLGHNGAGKTTLLRLFAGVYRPTSGSLRRAGRVSPVIGIGTPFAVDLTVEEHLRAYRQLLGGEPDSERALSYAGLTNLRKQPVRWLSTGERVRLAITPALLSAFDVYLIDEALAVCDPEYRIRAIASLRERVAAGAIVILAGQDLLTARALCRRGTLIRRGRIELDSDIDQAITTFTTSWSRGEAASEAAPSEGMLALELVGSGSASWARGQPVRLRFRVHGIAPPFQLLVALKTRDGSIVHSSRTRYAGAAKQAEPATAGALDIDIEIPGGALSPGGYRVAASVVSEDATPLVTREDAGFVRVDGD